MSRSQFDDEEHIQTTTTERLVYMANQIARFFAAQPHDAAVAGIAKHVKDFWDPRMRQLIHTHIAAGGAGLDPVALEAISTLPG